MFPTLSNKILFCYAGLGLAMKYETGDRREGKGREGGTCKVLILELKH